MKLAAPLARLTVEGVAELPSSQLLELQGAGHAIAETRPEAIVDAVLKSRGRVSESRQA